MKNGGDTRHILKSCAGWILRATNDDIDPILFGILNNVNVLLSGFQIFRSEKVVTDQHNFDGILVQAYLDSFSTISTMVIFGSKDFKEFVEILLFTEAAETSNTSLHLLIVQNLIEGLFESRGSMAQNDLAHEIFEHHRLGDFCNFGKMRVKFVFVKAWGANDHCLNGP